MAFCFYSTNSPPTELCCIILVIQAYSSPIQNTGVKMYLKEWSWDLLTMRKFRNNAGLIL